MSVEKTVAASSTCDGESAKMKPIGLIILRTYIYIYIYIHIYICIYLPEW